MKKRLLGLFMVMVLCITSFAGCKKDGKQPTAGTEENNSKSGEDAQTDDASGETADESNADERYQTSGKVVVAVNSGRSTDTYNLFANFNKYYPNIELETLSYDVGTSEFLTAQAAAGTMPDVVIDDESQLYYYASQGWVLPLDEYVVDDNDYTYVPQPIKDSYTYDGKLYALPMQAHFNTVFINLDLLEKLNLDLPELNWTPEDYKEFLKKGTTKEYSGTEILWGIDETFSGSMIPGASYYGYDMESRTFKTSESWVDAVNLMVELRAYPGLEAWSLRNSNVDGDSNDYVKKFGEGNLDDLHMAFKMGKILTDPRGTWDVSWLKDLSFEWTLWPWPQGDNAEGHLPMHVNNSWVVSSTKNPEAAFEVARYFTYSKEGNLERISMYETGDTDDYTLNEKFYIPTTNHPEVAERFKALENVSEGIAYMYDNENNSFRADLSKIVPGWDQVNSEYLSPRGNEVRDGIEDAAAVAAELDDVATKAIQAYWNEFEDKLAAFK